MPLPPGHDRIGVSGVDDLTVDGKNQLHWKGNRLTTEVRLTAVQKFVAGFVALTAFLASIASLADSYVSLTKAPDATDVGSGQDEQPPSLTASGLYFYTNSAVLRPESADNLDALATELLADQTLSIEIRGYTDSYGSPSHNQKLSEERAASVAQWLYGRGIARGRVRSQGFGASNPIADNATAEGRAANRRVEILRVETAASAAHSGG